MFHAFYLNILVQKPSPLAKITRILKNTGKCIFCVVSWLEGLESLFGELGLD